MRAAPPLHPSVELWLVSEYVFSHLEQGRALHVEPGEETLTDNFLLALKRRRFPFIAYRGRLPTASRISVYKFANTQEGFVGADWNLFFRDRTGRRRSLRIQAKRQYVNGTIREPKTEQGDRLLNLSRAQGALGLFALYSGPLYDAAGARVPIRSRCLLLDDAWKGCQVVPASVVLNSDGSRKANPTWSNSARGVVASARPIQCLFACVCLDTAASERAAKDVSLGTVATALSSLDMSGEDLEAWTGVPDFVDSALEALAGGDTGPLQELSDTDYFDAVAAVISIADDSGQANA